MSHTFSNLKRQLPGGSTKHSRIFAENVPLVHVPRNICDSPKLLFSLGKEIVDGTSHSKKTIRAIKLLGLPVENIVFYYAGRVFPEATATPICLICKYKDCDTVKGGCTPFDSGGLVAEDPKNRLLIVPLDWSDDQRVKYFKEHKADLHNWREYFGMFLSCYFDAPRDYWVGRPQKVIDYLDYSEIRDNAAVDIRNWTFEITIESNITISDCDLIVLNKTYSDFIREKSQIDVDPFDHRLEYLSDDDIRAFVELHCMEVCNDKV